MFNGIFLLGNNFDEIFNLGNNLNIIPGIVNGIFAVLWIYFLVYGSLAEKYDISKIKNYKRKLLK